MNLQFFDFTSRSSYMDTQRIPNPSLNLQKRFLTPFAFSKFLWAYLLYSPSPCPIAGENEEHWGKGMSCNTFPKALTFQTQAFTVTGEGGGGGGMHLQHNFVLHMESMQIKIKLCEEFSKEVRSYPHRHLAKKMEMLLWRAL